MRNLLEEFDDAPPGESRPVTIVGFPEHIFTQSSGFVTAIYMAVQERYFGTFFQRMLADPLDVRTDRPGHPGPPLPSDVGLSSPQVRMHYGHPDLLDKLHFLSRGGVSKASKEINLSEDVFAGYKTALAAGSVVFREYMQVGRG